MRIATVRSVPSGNGGGTVVQKMRNSLLAFAAWRESLPPNSDVFRLLGNPHHIDSRDRVIRSLLYRRDPGNSERPSDLAQAANLLRGIGVDDVTAGVILYGCIGVVFDPSTGPQIFDQSRPEWKLEPVNFTNPWVALKAGWVIKPVPFEWRLGGGDYFVKIRGLDHSFVITTSGGAVWLEKDGEISNSQITYLHPNDSFSLSSEILRSSDSLVFFFHPTPQWPRRNSQ